MPKDAPPGTRRLSALSTSFATMSFPGGEGKPELIRPIIVIGLTYFKEGPTVEEVRQLVTDRLIQFPRMRSKLTQLEDGAMAFEEIPEEAVDIEYHVEELALKDGQPMSEEELNNFLCDLYMHDLDHNRPLWKYMIVPKIFDGRCLCIFLADHVVGDGITFMEVFRTLLDGEAPPVPSKRKKVAVPVMKQVHAAVGGVGSVLGNVVFASDPDNGLKLKDPKQPNARRSFGTTDSIELSKLKEAKTIMAGTTVNDIILAIMNITIRRYFEEKKDPIMTAGKHIRGNFPINMRKPGTNVLEESFGNKVATGNFDISLDYANPVELVWKIKRQIDKIRSSPEPVIMHSMIGYLTPNMSHSKVLDMTIDTYNKVTCQISSVMAPLTEVSLCGHSVDDVNFLATPPMGLYFGICTYNGKVSAGIVLDAGCEPDAKELGKHFVPAFEELYEAIVVNSAGLDLTPPPAQSQAAEVKDQVARVADDAKRTAQVAMASAQEATKDVTLQSAAAQLKSGAFFAFDYAKHYAKK